MYICKECGRTFETPIKIKEEGYEHDCSPCCKEAFGNANECEVCGKYIDADESHILLCPECKHRAIERFKYLLGGFKAEELKYLDEITAGDTLLNYQDLKDYDI